MSSEKEWPFHVVFLPGFVCDRRLFEAQMGALSDIGIGWSFEPFTEGLSIREFAARALRHSTKPLALVGLSMGGIVAMNAARLAPDRVVSLSLLNTTPFADQAGAIRKDQIHRVRNGELSTILRDELALKYVSPHGSSQSLRDLVVDMGKRVGPEVFAQQSIALMTRRSMLGSLPDITCPTLIITGEDDRVCPPEISRTMHDLIPESELVVLPDCGHLSTLDASEQVSDHLIRHLNTVRAHRLGTRVMEAFL